MSSISCLPGSRWFPFITLRDGNELAEILSLLETVNTSSFGDYKDILQSNFDGAAAGLRDCKTCPEELKHPESELLIWVTCCYISFSVVSKCFFIFIYIFFIFKETKITISYHINILDPKQRLISLVLRLSCDVSYLLSEPFSSGEFESTL